MCVAIIKGILVGLFMAISVGPTLFIIIRYSLTSSYKAGLAFVLGVSFSDILYVTISNVAAIWLQKLAPYERYIAFGGAIVLMIMGITSFFKNEDNTAPTEQKTITGGHYARIWLSGFLVNTLNPGVLITWLGIVTIIANTTVLYRIVLFATCLILILGLDFLKVFLASKIKNVLTPKRITYMHRISAICIFGIGAFLMLNTVLNMNKKDTKQPSRIDRILSSDKK
jgi:threonine/homoserine/homoserine lactone efflux protein